MLANWWTTYIVVSCDFSLIYLMITELIPNIILLLLNWYYYCYYCLTDYWYWIVCVFLWILCFSWIKNCNKLLKYIKLCYWLLMNYFDLLCWQLNNFCFIYLPLFIFLFDVLNKIDWLLVELYYLFLRWLINYLLCWFTLFDSFVYLNWSVFLIGIRKFNCALCMYLFIN